MNIVFYIKDDKEKGIQEVSFFDFNDNKIVFTVFMKEMGRITISRNNEIKEYNNFLDEKIETKNILERYAINIFICKMKHNENFNIHAKKETRANKKEKEILNSIIIRDLL